MTQNATTPSAPDRFSWSDLSRVEAWAGEMRVNVIRLLAIALFYGRHLVEVMWSPADSPVRGAYHLRVTWVCLLWAAVAILVHVSLRRRRMPEWLKYATTACDVLLVTFLCALNGGPRSSLVLLYFPVIASAPLRLSLGLVYYATGGAMAAYLALLGWYAWAEIGFDRYYATPELRIPRREEAITLLSLLVAGLFAGQCIRQAKRIVRGYPVTIEAATTDLRGTPNSS